MQKDKDLEHYKELYSDISIRIGDSDLREVEYEGLLNAKNFELTEKDNEIRHI